MSIKCAECLKYFDTSVSYTKHLLAEHPDQAFEMLRNIICQYHGKYLDDCLMP